MSIALQHLADRLGKSVTKIASDSLTAYCPCHNDKTPSLKARVVPKERGSRVEITCFAGCTREDIYKALGLSFRDLYDNNNGIQIERPRRIEEYVYYNEQSEVLYQVVRYEPKDFKLERAGRDGKWIKGLGNVRPVLYSLPDVIVAIRKRQYIFVVEGEKDADRLHSRGLCATTCIGGAKGWHSEYAQSLIGASEVFIIPDNDEAGRGFADNVASSCHRLGIPCRIISLPGLPHKGDVSDWLDAGGHTEALLLLAEQSSAWTPEKRRGRPSKDAEIGAFLIQILMNGAVPVTTVEQKAREFGYGVKALQRARTRLGIKRGTIGTEQVFALQRTEIRHNRQSLNQSRQDGNLDFLTNNLNLPHKDGNFQSAQSHWNGNSCMLKNIQREKLIKLSQVEEQVIEAEQENRGGGLGYSSINLTTEEEALAEAWLRGEIPANYCFLGWDAEGYRWETHDLRNYIRIALWGHWPSNDTDRELRLTLCVSAWKRIQSEQRTPNDVAMSA